MRVIVVGAGAWGLPTATRLAEAGHSVTLIDRWGPGNPLSSSPGPSRIWRLADHRPDRVELSIYGLEALARSATRSNLELFTTSGMLWRHEASNEAVASSLLAAGVAFKRVQSGRVSDYFDGLKPSGVDAVWSPLAGTLLASNVISAETQRFKNAGGEMLIGANVLAVQPSETEPSVTLKEAPYELKADVVVVAAGMGAKALLDPLLTNPLPFVTRLEQVVHFGSKETLYKSDNLPTIFDGAKDDGPNSEPGMYGMATPGVGYKFGVDTPIRSFDISDPDRTPSTERSEEMRLRVARDFEIVPEIIDAQVCNWTDSPDGDFVIDRLPGNIVVAAGDSGEGFKFTSLIGEILADLATDQPPRIDISRFAISRFADNPALMPDTSGQSLSLRRFGE